MLCDHYTVSTSSPVKCASCGSERVTPLTKVLFFKGDFQVWFKNDPNPGFLSSGSDYLRASRARVCGDCGYVMLYASKRGLAWLNKDWSKLQSDLNADE